jgi:hypothetical protein
VNLISILEAQGRLVEPIGRACSGETAVLTVGHNEVMLSQHVLNLEENGPELEAESLKSSNGNFTPHSSEKMRAARERIIR